MNLKESDASGHLLCAPDDDVVNVIVPSARNVKNTPVAVRRRTACLLGKESDWADFIEESELWFDLAWEANR